MNEIYPGNIEGLIINNLVRHTDERGWLMELFREDELPEYFLPSMAYMSMTRPQQVRGPHEHKKQIDYFCFMGYSAFAVYFWDNRASSKTYNNKFKIKITEKDWVAIIIPAGVVHAYKNIGNSDGLVINAPDRLYAGTGKSFSIDEIRYEGTGDNRFELF